MHGNNRVKPVQLYLRQVSGAYKGTIFILVLLQLILGISSVCYALFLRGMIDGAVGGELSTLARFAILLGALVVFQLSLRAVFRWLEERTRCGIENGCKMRLFRDLLEKDYEEVSNHHSAQWMNYLTADTTVVADGLAQMLPMAAGLIARMGSACIVLLWVAPRLGYVVVPAGFLLILFTMGLRGFLKRLHGNIREADGQLRAFLQERIGAMVMVRVFQRQQLVLQQAEEKMQAHEAARMKRLSLSNACNTGFGLVMNGAYLLVAIYCGYGIYLGNLTYGTFTAVLQLVSQIQSPLSGISGILPQYTAMLSSAERLLKAEAGEREELLEEEAKGREARPETETGLKKDNGGIRTETEEEQTKEEENGFSSFGLRNVTFAYQNYDTEEGTLREAASFTRESSGGSEQDLSDSDFVLKDFSLEIFKGDYVAFLGPSGCGKSTVLGLLLGLLKPQQGQCFVKNQEEEPLTPAHRRLFSYVPQGNQLLSGRIRDMVAFDDPEGATRDEKLWEALDLACAKEFVEALPLQLDTCLGEKGHGLSEGQLQRLAIARALFSQRPILLLDEATSALDEATEEALLTKLKTRPNQTVFVISHRPRVLAYVNRIITFGPEGIAEK